MCVCAGVFVRPLMCARNFPEEELFPMYGILNIILGRFWALNLFLDGKTHPRPSDPIGIDGDGDFRRRSGLDQNHLLNIVLNGVIHHMPCGGVIRPSCLRMQRQLVLNRQTKPVGVTPASP
jgi:hypothetical protein